MRVVYRGVDCSECVVERDQPRRQKKNRKPQIGRIFLYYAPFFGKESSAKGKMLKRRNAEKIPQAELVDDGEPDSAGKAVAPGLRPCATALQNASLPHGAFFVVRSRSYRFDSAGGGRTGENAETLNDSAMEGFASSKPTFREGDAGRKIWATTTRWVQSVTIPFPFLLKLYCCTESIPFPT